MCDCGSSSPDQLTVIRAINDRTKSKQVTDHKLHVIGAGLGRTGTSSISQVLNDLGFNTHHCYEIMHGHRYNEWHYVSSMTPALRACLGVWDHLYSSPIHYNAAVDFPTSAYAEEIYNYYKSKGQSPKVILTIRDDVDEWYQSTKQTIYSLYQVRKRFYWSFMHGMKAGNVFLTLQWNALFNAKFEDKEYAIDIYKKHNQYIQKVIPKEDLLIIHIDSEKDGNGYQQIMDFLAVEDNDLRAKYENKPLPQCNKRQRIKGLVAMHKQKADRFNALCYGLTLTVMLSIAGYMRYRAYNNSSAKQQNL